MHREGMKATKRNIDRAIKPLGLEIVNTRGDGYSYFLDLKTGYQIGGSVAVCYLNQVSVERWTQFAADALKEKAI